MTVFEALGKALEALDGVTVHGKDDMSRMLEAIGLIEESIRALQDAKEAESHGSDGGAE